MTADCDLQGHADRAFLALCLWREARGESREVQTGVVHVILSRARKPGWWGGDLMGVLFKRWQFSSLTDPRDRQLTTWPKSNDPSWIQCLEIACASIDGELANPLPGADHYYDISIPPPKWAAAARFVGQLGRIRFYNLERD